MDGWPVRFFAFSGRDVRHRTGKFVCLSLTDLAIFITACTERFGCAPYGRHTLIRCAHPSGQPAAVTPLRYVSLLAQERCAKEGHPNIRVSLRETTLAPAPLRGPAYKGHPWPFKRGRHRYFAASMRLAPLCNTSIRPPKGELGAVCEIALQEQKPNATDFDLAEMSQAREMVPLQEAEWNRRVRG